ncbi:MAG: hypothetical protein Q8Q08_11380 [Candidatus Omnitrophota bacterium]|nr:hypothetical protein [Candidatus Omnitrophota bacterium]MDZ4242081.1 hypothetical protein [Candidatus Omnitrophota bacterium]
MHKIFSEISRASARNVLFFAVAFAAMGAGPAAGEDWQELKGDHFVVYFAPASGRETARTVLRRAEEYYKKIGARIGYSRYQDFWTWDERAKIFIFPDQRSFMQATGQPAWSKGYADRDSYLFESRAIVTYFQEDRLVDGLLPHEISHLILRDFIGEASVPIWFEEGVAQLEEAGKSAEASRTMKLLVPRRQHIPFGLFMAMDVRREKDPRKAQIFYAQSLSVVEFLIKKYGSDTFGRLCRNLRDGRPFPEALAAAYAASLPSLADLEIQWVRRMSL